MTAIKIEFAEEMRGIPCGPENTAYKCRYSRDRAGVTWSSHLCPDHQAQQAELSRQALERQAHQGIEDRLSYIERVLSVNGLGPHEFNDTK